MEKIFFIHIPKTAGATYRSILKKNYKKQNSFFVHDIYPEISLDYLRRLPDEKFNKFDLIAGHGTQYLLSRAKKFKSITFLRDPIKQIISSYYHIKRSPHNRLHEDLKNINSLKDYFYYLHDKKGFNLQTYYLSRNETDFRFSKRFDEINENNFASALTMLKNIDFVFLTEKFNESLLILKKELDVKKIFYTYQNLSKERLYDEEKNPELLQKLQEAQVWDYKLYNHAVERYMNLKKKFGQEFDLEVSKFNNQNKIYNNTIGMILHVNQKFKNLLDSYHPKEKSWLVKPEYD